MSTLPQGSFGERRGGWRRKPLIVGGVLLVLIVVWTYFVLSFGGGDQTPEKASSANNGAASTVPDEPAYAEDASAGGDSAPNAPSTDGSGDQSDPSPEGAGTASGPRESRAHDHPEGATNEPGSYDPLGTGASAGDLVPVDEQRLRFAAARFVSAAYGYSGKNKDAYNQGVGAAVVRPDFFDSSGSSEITRYADQVGDTGTTSAAVLTRYETLDSSAKSATGYAYFDTGSGYSASGGLKVDKQSYRQKMTLTRSGSAWKVLSVNDIEET